MMKAEEQRLERSGTLDDTVVLKNQPLDSPALDLVLCEN